MSPRNRRHRHRSASLLLWGTLSVVLVLGYLNEHPIGLGSDDDRVAGRPERGSAHSDVLVVVWPDEIARSADTGRFQDIDWSWSWVDMLVGELGPVEVIGPDDLPSHELEAHRFVVVTYSAMAHPAVGEASHRFERFVNGGGTLMLERPQGVIRDVFSADGRGGLRTPRAITTVEAAGERVREGLTQLPLFTRYVGSTAPLAGSETLLGMDGAPVIYRLNRAAGTAVTVDFNLGLALVSVQQGRPSESGFEVAASGETGPMVADLVADPGLIEADVPYADLLEHFVVHVALAGESPLVGYWHLPDGADGQIVLTHDVTDSADQAVWMARHESAHAARATFFVGYAATPGEASVAGFRDANGELSVLWERGDDPDLGNVRRLGLGGLRPFYRKASLEEQRDALQGAAGRSRGVRLRDGLWGDDYAGPFQAQAAAGFGYDSSYGQGVGSPGLPAYRHGTGRPFLVYDQNGLPFGIYEVPLVAPELARPAQLERFDELLTDSRDWSHQVLAVQVSADLFEQDDALTRFDAWRDLFEQQERMGHPITDLRRLLTFTRRRAASDLRVEVQQERDLDGDAGVVRLMIEVAPQIDGLWLRLPRTIGEVRFREALQRTISEGSGRPGAALPERDVAVFGQEVTLVELPAGTRLVEAVYR